MFLTETRKTPVNKNNQDSLPRPEKTLVSSKERKRPGTKGGETRRESDFSEEHWKQGASNPFPASRWIFHPNFWSFGVTDDQGLTLGQSAEVLKSHPAMHPDRTGEKEHTAGQNSRPLRRAAQKVLDNCSAAARPGQVCGRSGWRGRARGSRLFKARGKYGQEGEAVRASRARSLPGR